MDRSLYLNKGAVVGGGGHTKVNNKRAEEGQKTALGMRGN